MTDVFISYAREDQAVSKALCDILEGEGWEVWYDQELYAGAKWESELLGVLDDAKAVVVLWSAAGVASPWVRREAELALGKGKLIPVALDDTLPPAPFDAVEAARLSGWTGAADHPELPMLFAGLGKLAQPSRIDTVRPGYEIEFLGESIELPEIPGTGDEYPYLHFSVVMNPGRRLAYYAAYNMRPPDARPQRQDNWQPDPTLPRAFQPAAEQYARSEYDRGHLVSPGTVAWGDLRRADIAMRQAFYWTNTSPQTRIFNQSWWLRLERWERSVAAERGRATGFSGPTFADDDPLYRATSELRGRLRAHGTFRVPRRYWKLVVAPGKRRAGLEYAAFAVENLPADTVGQHTRRLELGALEETTGLTFASELHKASPLTFASGSMLTG
jgi:DNA/RNA endonuclease G (NUC1)